MEQSKLPPIPKGDPTKEDFEKLKTWYAEELERKDRMIEQLKKENMLIVKSSLKTSERLAVIQGTKSPSDAQGQAHQDE